MDFECFKQSTVGQDCLNLSRLCNDALGDADKLVILEGRLQKAFNVGQQHMLRKIKLNVDLIDDPVIDDKIFRGVDYTPKEQFIK